jgi:putative membrane protein
MNNHIFIGIIEGMSWIVIWPILYLFITFINHKRRSWKNNETKSALDILKERYAKGEIDKKTFDEIKKDI